MSNFRDIIFIWTGTYSEIFKFALVYLIESVKHADAPVIVQSIEEAFECIGISSITFKLFGLDVDAAIVNIGGRVCVCLCAF